MFVPSAKVSNKYEPHISGKMVKTQDSVLFLTYIMTWLQEKKKPACMDFQDYSCWKCLQWTRSITYT